ncbi:MAG TPA: hypothetical protein VGR35_18510 [Tepidisphaeraceae bacterium]|nr:hypothetical protein [Tepidisphaeraceae bacterium]
MRRDITDVRVLYLKGMLFLLSGTLAALLILLEFPDMKLAALLALSVWCFARAYYFAFYVIEHYVDPGYRFSGLWPFIRYAMRRRSQDLRSPARRTSRGP